MKLGNVLRKRQNISTQAEITEVETACQNKLLKLESPKEKEAE
jgi:hypothetical protein